MLLHKSSSDGRHLRFWMHRIGLVNHVDHLLGSFSGLAGLGSIKLCSCSAWLTLS